jgi:hypothetical protein
MTKDINNIYKESVWEDSKIYLEYYCWMSKLENFDKKQYSWIHRQKESN